jgi:hypothetical protein
MALCPEPRQRALLLLESGNGEREVAKEELGLFMEQFPMHKRAV